MFVSIAAAANFLGSYAYSSPACFSAGRILIGIFSGFSTGVCPMYIMEMAPKKDRGWIGVLNQLLITIGILGLGLYIYSCRRQLAVQNRYSKKPNKVAQIMALPSIMGQSHLWGYFLASTAVPAILWLLTYFYTGWQHYSSTI